MADLAAGHRAVRPWERSEILPGPLNPTILLLSTALPAANWGSVVQCVKRCEKFQGFWKPYKSQMCSPRQDRGYVL